MKKLTMMLLVGMTIALTACGTAAEEPRNSEDTEITAEDSDDEEEEVSDDEPDIDIPSEESLIDDFREAQEIWFEYEGGLETDYTDSVEGQISAFDTEFYRVSEPGIGSLQELKDYLSARVDEDFVEELLNDTDQFMEVDGNLYMCPAGRGDDLSIGWVEFAAETDGETGKVIVTIHRQDYFSLLEDWYETGDVDSYEYSFTLEDGHAIFDSMDYLCGSFPEESPRAGYDADSLETALVSLLEGRWLNEDGSNYYEICDDGSFTFYINDEESGTGYIFSSRCDDCSYMMNGDDFNGTIFTLGFDEDGIPVILFDNGGTVFTIEGKG